MIFQVRNKYFILILFFIIICIFISCTKQINKIPKSKNGVLDLRGWDFNRDGTIRLDGEWEFYWNKLLFPDDFKKSEVLKMKSYFIFPNLWFWGYGKNKNSNIKENGYATFRLNILVEPKKFRYGLHIPGIYSCYKLWINDQFILETGKLGEDKKSSLPVEVPKTEYFVNNNYNQISILIQIANFYHIKGGGLPDSIILGEKEEIQRNREISIGRDVFLLGFVIMMSFYNLILFFYRKKERSSFYFAAFCLLIAIRNLKNNEAFLCILFPQLNNYILSWHILYKLEYITAYLAPAIFALFIYYLYPEENFKKLNYIIAYIGFFFTFFILVMPIKIFAHLYFISDYLLIPFLCIYSIIVYISVFIKKKEGALLSLIGVLILFVTVMNDVLKSNQLIYSIDIVSFGLASYILLNTFIFSMRFSKTFAYNEELLINLEQKVIERTEELSIANEQKTQFFINIAHETKTPLTLIKNYMEKYIKSISLTKELKIIKHNIEKLLRDMVNFLNAERLRGNQVYYNHNQITDVTEILGKKIILFRENAKQKHIDLLTNIASNPIYLKGDPYAVNSIINNLIDNAIKYTEEYGKVMINLEEKDDELVFTIKDNGIGIPEEQINNIFEPFYQLSNKKKKIQGIGMGLFIVYKIIESLKGSIDVKSRENEGTTFIVKLKTCIPGEFDNIQKDVYLPPFPDIYPDKINLIEKRINPQKYTVFIVEDNLEMLDFLVSELQKYYNVFFESNGKLALEKLEEISKPHIIISDIMMDEMDGIDFFKNINEIEKYQSIPFIFLTAKTGIENKLNGLKAGAIDYISKPFLMDELLLKIKSILNNLEMQKKSELNKIEKKINQTISELKMKSNGTEIPKLKNIEVIYEKYQITYKEEKILDLLLQGYQNKEICSILDISIKTVENHLHKIYKKFNVNNRIELFKFLKL